MAFGVPRLDQVFAQEAPGQALLIRNEPGVDAQPFLLQAACTALAAGGTVVYLVTDRSPARVRKLIEKAGGDTTRLQILDAHSILFGVGEPGQAIIDPSNVADVEYHMDQAAAAYPGALFILDSLNGLMLHAQTTQLVAAAPRLMRSMQRFQSSVAAYTYWTEELAVRPFLQSFPHCIHLSAVQDRIITSQYFRLEKIGGRNASPAPTLYRAHDHGLLQVYIPKIVVTGPAGAGKSTFIHRICDHAVSAERMGATVALDRGTIDRQGLHVDLFGTPGQERFDPLIAPIMANAMAVILMVDANDPASFERADYMLQKSWKLGIQVIVAANKQDLDGALSAPELAKHFNVPKGTEVVPCVATDDVAVEAVLQRLLDRILSPQVIV